MIYLLLSIITSTIIFIGFKLVARKKVKTIQAIVVNYLVCVVEGVIAQQYFPSLQSILQSDWLITAILMGFLFISIFYVTALTVKYNGMSVASIANKLSLIIPASLAFVLYNDPVTPIKLVGIFLAMVAVVLASYKKEKSGEKAGFGYYIFPALVLAGSGIIDAATKYCQENFLTDAEFNLFLIFVFGTAAFTGCLILFYRYLFLQEKIELKSIGYGLFIGIPNYGSMYFLIAALNHPMFSNSSTFFPLNNISIVVATTLTGWLIFKEKLTVVNLVGLLLSVAAIFMITYGIW